MSGDETTEKPGGEAVGGVYPTEAHLRAQNEQVDSDTGRLLSPEEAARRKPADEPAPADGDAQQ